MKIHYKLILGFLAVALLVGVVAITLAKKAVKPSLEKNPELKVPDELKR